MSVPYHFVPMFLSLAHSQYPCSYHLNRFVCVWVFIEVIGAHLHTGSSTTNGPVAVIFCGVDPLPAMNGPCTVSNVNDIYDDRYLADWESQTVDPDVAFTSGGTYLHSIMLTILN